MGLLHFNFLPQNVGFHTNVYVILPESKKEAPYKTLYLLHGGGGNGQDWMRYTSIERYAEEYGLAVVMPEVGGSSFYADEVHGYRYYSYLTEELPMVLECFLPLSRAPEDRFVAGLSMGGYGAYKWAFDRPEFFAAAANLSGFSFITDIFEPGKGFASHEAADEKGLVNIAWGGLDGLRGTISDTRYMADHAAESGKALPRLFAAIGTEDFSYEYGKQYLAYLKEKGIEVHYEEMPGKHEWKVWDEKIESFIRWALKGQE